ncbi:MAG: RadC family protein [Christensenellaceae bacterium]
MYTKLCNTPDALEDHELLEILLYFTIPRANTNESAHELLRRFGSFDAIFRADPKDLTAIDGIGSNSANFLKCIGQVLKRIHLRDHAMPTLFSPASFSQFVKEEYEHLEQEVFDIYFMDKAGKLLGSKRMTSELRDRVEISSRELMNAISASKAARIILVHNHVGDPAIPSPDDDELTIQTLIICRLAGVQLADHLIYGTNGIYSYQANDRFTYLQGTSGEGLF